MRPLKLQGTFLRSRVARRIFTLFMLAAFLPVLVLLALSGQQVREVLDAQARAQLLQAASSYANQVYDQLLASDAALQTIARGWTGSGPPPALSDLAGRAGLRSVELVRADGGRRAYLGSGVGALPAGNGPGWDRLAQNRSFLYEARTASDGVRLLLLRSLPAHPRAVLAAELNPAFLWGDPESYPYLTRFCVRAGASALLNCTSEQDRAAILRLAQQAGSAPDSRRGGPILRWESEGGASLAASKDLFLLPQFGASTWTFLAIAPETRALAPVRAFAAIFLLTALLALSVVALFSVTSIRRTLVPLERLIEGTRRIARHDFSSPVTVAAEDEFGELARSMNGMALRLGRQFKALSTLSEIDRLILTALDVERVVDTLLQSVSGIVELDAASLALLEPGPAGTLRTRTWIGGGVALLDSEHSLLPAGSLERIAGHPGGLVLNSNEAAEMPFLAGQRAGGASSFLVLPVLWQDRPCAIFALGWRNPVELDEELIGRLRSLGDRIGVALSAAAREEQLLRQAHFDELSGLPNRWLFKDRLAQELARALRDQHLLAVLFIDLDRFKTVNDTRGHEAGDDVLREAAARLHGVLRDSDTAARLGGDEFAVILPGLTSPEQAAPIATKLLDALAQPFDRSRHAHYLSASIGIALYPADGDSVEALLRNADTAMYRAKDAGRGRFVFFETRMNVEAVRRLSLERDLRRALERGEFALYYQPQISLKDGSVAGAEALVRWNDPEQGLILPGRFIQLAEETGIIDVLGEWILQAAAAQYAAWRADGIVLPRLAVNVAGRQFRQKGFVATVQAALEQAGMDPAALELELTEGMLIGDADTALRTMVELSALGVRIAIDDFGTGYSSMAYLKRLPAQVVKIERAFIHGIESDPDAAQITRAIIAMSHMLRRQIVAEGVETAAQVALLRAWHCDQIQGFHISQPLAPADFSRWVRARRSATAAVAVAPA